MPEFNIVGDSDKLFRALQDALVRGLATSRLKKLAELEAKKEIEKAVNDTQDMFRPDRGPDGGDDLVALLGIGQGGRPLTKKYAGKDAAYTLLKPGQAATSFSSTFRRRTRGSFGIITYNINLENFYNNFRSTYISRKAGDSDFEISWMRQLLNGIPTEQVREYPDGENQFALVTGGPNFNVDLSRTGLGHMVATGRLKIPPRQFSFSGRGESAAFGALFKNINRRLSSNKFKNKLEKIVAKAISGSG